MKTTPLCLTTFGLMVTSIAQAAVTHDFTGNSSFDGETILQIALLDDDNGFSTTMTVIAGGGTFNSNAGDFGIDSAVGTNDEIDGTAESITITFSTDVEFNFIDLGGVGVGNGGGLDAASLTIAGATTILQTGVSGFAGTQDIYTPASPISLLEGQSIILTGADTASVIDLEMINITVVPEPQSYALLASFCALSFGMYRRR